MSNLLRNLNDMFKIAEIKRHRISASIISEAIDHINHQEQRIKELEQELDALEDEVQCYESVHENMVNKESKWMLRLNLEQQAKGIEDALQDWKSCSDVNLRTNLKHKANQLRKQAEEL